jgi:hypothetical protein
LSPRVFHDGRYIGPWAAQYFSHCSENGEDGIFNQSLNLTTIPLLFEAVNFREKPDLIGNARQRPHCIAFWLLAFLEGFRRDFTTGQEGMGGTRKTAFTTGCSLRHGLDVLGMLQTESRWTAARRQVFGTLTDKGRGASLKI